MLLFSFEVIHLPKTEHCFAISSIKSNRREHYNFITSAVNPAMLLHEEGALYVFFNNRDYNKFSFPYNQKYENSDFLPMCVTARMMV